MSMNQGLEALTSKALEAQERLEVSPAQPPIEDDGKGCERCGCEEPLHGNLCEDCNVALGQGYEEEEDSYQGPEDADVNDGFTVIRGGDVGPRRPWAAKEPLKSKKRVLYQGEEDYFSLSGSDDDERDSIDDDAPDLLGYLGDFPGLTGITKISMLRAAANYLSSQQRATKPFQSPKVAASNDKKTPPAPKKKAKTFVTKKVVPYPNKRK